MAVRTPNAGKLFAKLSLEKAEIASLASPSRLPRISLASPSRLLCVSLAPLGNKNLPRAEPKGDFLIYKEFNLPHSKLIRQIFRDKA